MDPKIVEIIAKVANNHKKKTFGFMLESDIEGEVWRICLEKLPLYNKDKGCLENFLNSVVHNSLNNCYKTITKSVRSPCNRCPFHTIGIPGDCSKFGEEKMKCRKWKNYTLSVESRNSLLNNSEPKNESFMSENVLNRMMGMELADNIIDLVDKSFKRDLNSLLSGERISKQQMKRLKKEVLRVLETEGSNE